MGSKWTEQELHLLRQYYPDCGAEIPALLQTRTRPAIRSRAYQLGIYHGGSHWSDKEIAILREQFPRRGSDIPELAYRPRSGIQAQAKAQGFKVMFKKPPHIQLTQKQWAYIAGFWDADGIISVSFNHSEGGRPRPNLAAFNSHAGVIAQLHTWLGGKIATRSRPNTNYPSHTLNICGQARMIAVLRGILPYLIVKKQQAELLLQLLESKHQRYRRDEYNEQEWVLIHRIRALNHQR